MRKKIFIIIFLLGMSGLTAHEFWLEPHRFIVNPGETVVLHFRVGENFEGQNWSGNRASVDKISLYYNQVTDNLSNLISDTLRGDSLKLQFFDEGTAMVGFHSTNKFIRLEPEKFLAYLQEDGLQNAINIRKEKNESDSAGREWYQRSVKTIFQVGKKKDDSYGKNCGLPLEFIPMQNPYELKKGQPLGVRVLFGGKPWRNALVKCWNRLNDKTDMKEMRSDENGQVSIPVSLAGKWMLSTVRMERLALKDTADWQSYWGSLTWGY